VSGLASSLDLTVVAEGIETFEQLQYVVKQGCSAGQGYFFAKPLTPAEAYDYWVARSRETRI